MTWTPTPKHIYTIELNAQLIGCHEFRTTRDPTFSADVLLLIERLKNQTATSGVTDFSGNLASTAFFKINTLLFVNQIVKYINTSVNFASPCIITGNLTNTSTGLLVNAASTSGTIIVMQAFQSAVASNNQVKLGMGKNTSTNNALEIRYIYSTTTPYGMIALQGSSTNGLVIYPTYTDIVPQLRIKNVICNPIYNTAVTTITMNSSTPTVTNGITWSGTNINRIDVQFYNLTKSGSRSTIFLQCGQGTNFMTTTGDYSGFTIGNYDYELNPPGIVFSTTDNGIALFSDVAEVGFIFSGTVTLYKLGTVTGKGELWAVDAQVYSDNIGGSTPNGSSAGFGWVQMSSTYPSLTSIRFNAFSGAFSAGNVMVSYV